MAAFLPLDLFLENTISAIRATIKIATTIPTIGFSFTFDIYPLVLSRNVTAWPVNATSPGSIVSALTFGSSILVSSSSTINSASITSSTQDFFVGGRGVVHSLSFFSQVLFCSPSIHSPHSTQFHACSSVQVLPGVVVFFDEGLDEGLEGLSEEPEPVEDVP